MASNYEILLIWYFRILLVLSIPPFLWSITVLSLQFFYFANKLYRKLKLHYWPADPFPFMRLPPELRLKIYKYTLCDCPHYLNGHKARVWDLSHTPSLQNGEIAHPFFALFHVSRVMREEVQPLFYSHTKFVVTVYNDKDLVRTLEMLDILAPKGGEDVFAMMRHLRIKVYGVVCIDVCGDAEPWYRIQDGKKVFCFEGRFGVFVDRCRDKSLMAKKVGIVLKKVTPRKGVRREVLKEILECIFKDEVLEDALAKTKLPRWKR